MLLSRTRVPIIKMKQKTSHGSGEIHCDIGFKNYLAIHNTHLLLCYSNCDVRVKQMVLFVKVCFARTPGLKSLIGPVVGQKATHQLAVPWHVVLVWICFDDTSLPYQHRPTAGSAELATSAYSQRDGRR